MLHTPPRLEENAIVFPSGLKAGKRIFAGVVRQLHHARAIHTLQINIGMFRIARGSKHQPFAGWIDADIRVSTDGGKSLALKIGSPNRSRRNLLPCDLPKRVHRRRYLRHRPRPAAALVR